MDKEKFWVIFWDFGFCDYDFSGYVIFNDLEEGNEICIKFYNKIIVSDNVVFVILEVYLCMYVLECVFKCVEKEIKDFCGKIRKEDRVIIDIK